MIAYHDALKRIAYTKGRLVSGECTIRYRTVSVACFGPSRVICLSISYRAPSVYMYSNVADVVAAAAGRVSSQSHVIRIDDAA